MNELLLCASVVVIFGSVVLSYRLFGTAGLYCISAVAVILANVEVLILVDAFGMEQTLGNVLFASTFLVTDILSECEGRRAANRAVWMGMFVSAFFLVVSQSWMLYQPAPDDWASGAIRTVFSNTPRLMVSSLAVYLVSQLFDVWLYHRWWSLTERLTGSRDRFLWLRNNGSTLVSQLINTVLYSLLAFWGVYDASTLLSIIASSYLIYIATSLLDTPALYLARRIKRTRGVGVALPGDGRGGASPLSPDDAADGRGRPGEVR